MRKIKKINGYLVVRFNDREKRLNEDTGIGSFGVIDAEQYTGILDIDRDVMEYDSAATLEEAVEQARGLEPELDVSEPQVKITIVTETDTGSSEEEVDPVSLLNAEKVSLEVVNNSCAVPELGGVLTTQRLYGYVSALRDLGIVDIGDERFQIDPALPPDLVPNLLSPTESPQNEPVCDNFRHPSSQEIGQTKLPAEQAAPIDTDANELDQAEATLEYVMQLVQQAVQSDEYAKLLQGMSTFGRLLEKERYTPSSSEKEKLEYLAIGLIDGSIHLVGTPMSPNLVQAEFIDTVRRKIIARFIFEQRFGGYYMKFTEFLTDIKTPENPVCRVSNFRHPPSDNQIYPQIYALGMQLLEDCPENDCTIFRNTFQLCIETDSQLDRLSGFPRRWLSRRIEREYRYLEQMFCYNAAVKAYRETHPIEPEQDGGERTPSMKEKAGLPVKQAAPCKERPARDTSRELTQLFDLLEDVEQHFDSPSPDHISR